MNIQRKLSISVISAFLAVYGIVALLGVYAIKDEKYLELNTRIAYLSDIASDAGAKDIWDFNIDGLKRFLKSFSEETAVSGVIYDLASIDTPGARELIGILDGEPVHQITRDVATSTLSDDAYYRVVRRPIHWEGNEIAQVYIYFSDRVIRTDMNKLVILFAVMLLAVVLILGVVIYSSLNLIVLKPFAALQALSSTSEDEIGRIRHKLEQQSQVGGLDLHRIDNLIAMNSSALGRGDEISGFTRSLVSLLETVKLSISELASHSHELAELNEQLEARIQDRTAELKTTNSALQKSLDSLKETQAKLVQQEKLASIGQLAAGVAHEINNPLGFVKSNLQTLREYTDAFKSVVDGVDEVLVGDEFAEARNVFSEKKKDVDYDFIVGDMDELFNDCDEGCIRVRDIVQNLKDFSRIDEQQAVSRFNINDAVVSALKLVTHRIKYNCIVRTELSNRLVIEADRGSINQVVANLILNAADAIDEAGRQGVINVRTFSDDKRVILEVSDTGTGIPTDVQPKIFDPFFTTKPVGKGTGLGLNISYDIVVNKHGGDIRCESTFGKGSTFTVELPVFEGKAA